MFTVPPVDNLDGVPDSDDKGIGRERKQEMWRPILGLVSEEPNSAALERIQDKHQSGNFNDVSDIVVLISSETTGSANSTGRRFLGGQR